MKFITLTRTQTVYEKSPEIYVRADAITCICRLNDLPDATVVSGCLYRESFRLVVKESPEEILTQMKGMEK